MSLWFNLDNEITKMEVLKEKMENLTTTQSWFIDDYYTEKTLVAERDLHKHGYGYCEQRITILQQNELLEMYSKELQEATSKLRAIQENVFNEYKKDRTHDEIGNGQHNVEQ